MVPGSQALLLMLFPPAKKGLALALWSMQIMLDKGKDADWFSSPLIVTLTIVTVIAFAALLIWDVYRTAQHSRR